MKFLFTLIISFISVLFLLNPLFALISDVTSEDWGMIFLSTNFLVAIIITLLFEIKDGLDDLKNK